ncbi:cupin domain-containing protein [Saccharothrix xinjiangensis]|uniref:Cupin domain-containing protein n=1 Tax=Saccharothrix xinjiangensis TaxID=204798 RepID=A0ABV9YF23_9PSEU
MTDAVVSGAGLEIVRWARGVVGGGTSTLTVPHGPLPTRLHGAEATGSGLVGNGAIGADLIRLAAGTGFPPHTHVGHHVLVIVGGRGTITYGGRVHPTEAGQVFLVEGSVSHAVGAITDHVVLAIGAPHAPVESDARMSPVDYREVLSEIGDLTCLVCGSESRSPDHLHDVGCPHCPCARCAAAESTR